MLRIIGYFLPASQPIGFMRKPSTSQPSAPLNGTRSTGDERELLPERRVEVRELLLAAAVQVGDVQIVEMRRIVDAR